MERTIDRERLFRYLLGELSEKEQEVLEQQYFNDRDCFAQVASAEDDLIDLYVLGKLSSHDRVRFESHFLGEGRASRRHRVEFSRTFCRYVEDHSLNEEIAPWWRAAFSMPRLALAGMALSLLLMGWFSYSVVRRQGEELARTKEENTRLQQQVREQKELAQKPQEPVVIAQAPKLPAAIPSYDLSPVLERSAGRAVTVRPNEAASVRFRLGLESNDWTSFQAALETVDGRRSWNVGGLKASGNAVVVMIPAAALQPGAYILRLSGTTAGGNSESVADYSFTVAR